MVRLVPIIALCALLVSVAPAAAQSGASTVVIAVPPAQHLTGDTALALPPSAVAHGQLSVRANTAWAVVARLSAPSVQVSWRSAGGEPWRHLGSGTVIARGERGVHPIAYEVRADGTASPAVTVTFSIEAR